MMKNTDSFVERLIRYGSYPAILGAAAYVMLLGVGSGIAGAAPAVSS